MSNRETSKEVARIASRILKQGDLNTDDVGSMKAAYRRLLDDSKKLAGSALSQREEDDTPAPGTHIYDMLASFAKADAENTETLIQLVAGTVLYKLFLDEGGGRVNIRFSPKDMDDMNRLFKMNASREGLDTVVVLEPREEAMKSWRLENQPEDYEGDTPAHDQAMPKAERPVWVIRYMAAKGVDGLETHFARMHDKADAERQLPQYFEAAQRAGDGRTDPVIENRMCLHEDCPAEHCNHVKA